MINDSVVNPVAGFSTSFSLTYHELENGVERPRLNESSIDPDFFRDDGSSKGGNDCSYSAVIRNWDWEMMGLQHDKGKEVATLLSKYIDQGSLQPILE